MNINKEQLIQILYSNYSARIDYEIVQELLFLLENDCLIYNKKKICHLNDFKSLIEKINNKQIDTFDIEGGGIRHLALKLIAIENYKDLYKYNKSEIWFYGYKPDLIFKNNNDTLIIECGDTNPIKLIEYFYRNEVKKVIIITYPHEGDVFIHQHIFYKGKEMDNYLEVKDGVIYDKIKKIIQRR